MGQLNVLVTGGCGVIGSHIAKRYLAAGARVSVIDSCEEPRNLWLRTQLLQAGAEVLVHRLERLNLDLETFDLVVHAAAWTGIPASAENPEDDWVSNVDATRVVVNSLKRAEHKPFTVVLSSVKPYSLAGAPIYEGVERYEWDRSNANTRRAGVSEQWPTDPDEPYAASKLAQSALCIAAARTHGLPITVLRCSNLYGPAPSHGPRHGWLTWFAISAAIGRPLVVQGTGYQTRDMLHADDVFHAVEAAYEKRATTQGQLYNIGGGHRNTISVLQAAKALQKLSGCEIVWGEGRQHEDMMFVTDYWKFAKAVDWAPAVDVHHGLSQLYGWAVENKEALIKMYEGV